ncbi:ABC transporter ATP-binding protein [Bordetella pertussis]|nr:ABC transporter ATP-binding protein [Bordetella pertussis]
MGSSSRMADAPVSNARATQGRTVVLATHARLPPGTVDTVYTLQAGRLHRAAPM